MVGFKKKLVIMFSFKFSTGNPTQPNVPNTLLTIFHDLDIRHGTLYLRWVWGKPVNVKPYKKLERWHENMFYDIHLDYLHSITFFLYLKGDVDQLDFLFHPQPAETVRSSGGSRRHGDEIFSKQSSYQHPENI